jgi:hypothetical protein
MLQLSISIAENMQFYLLFLRLTRLQILSITEYLTFLFYFFLFFFWVQMFGMNKKDTVCRCEIFISLEVTPKATIFFYVNKH